MDPEVDAARTGVAHAINYFMPSWDGLHVAYGMSAGGSEEASLHILEVRTGRLVGNPIPRVHESNASWLPDSRSLTYNQLEGSHRRRRRDRDVPGQPRHVAAPGPGRVAGAGGVRPHGQHRSSALARLEVGAILFTPGSRWMIARTNDTTQPEGSLFLAQVSDLGSAPVPWRRIASFDDRIVEIELKGDHLYYRTRQGAPRHRIMQLDLRQPELARAREVALPPDDGVLERIRAVRATIWSRAVRRGHGDRAAPLRAGRRARPLRCLAVSGRGPAAPTTPRMPIRDLLYTLSGWTQPPKVLRLQGRRSVDAGLAARREPAGAARGGGFRIQGGQP